MSTVSTWTVVAAAAAGGVGAVVRHLVSTAWTRRVPTNPRDGVALVNVVGSFALGLLAGAADAQHVSAATVVVLGGGLLGGLTTISTWLVAASRDGDWSTLGRDLALHLVLGLAAVVAGLAVW